MRGRGAEENGARGEVDEVARKKEKQRIRAVERDTWNKRSDDQEDKEQEKGSRGRRIEEHIKRYGKERKRGKGEKYGGQEGTSVIRVRGKG